VTSRRALVVVALAACSLPSRGEDIRTSSTDYRGAAMWMCRPDLGSDACRGDLTTTELLADGSRVVRAHAPAHDAPVDCFYIYPTVDLNLVPGNHVDFSDVSTIRKVVAAQVARFSEVCNVYAPLYRQVTIGTYLLSDEKSRRYFDVAYSDVAAAFHAYLLHFDRGRPIVILGHSQGSKMAENLLRDTFDHSDELRSRLLVAMPIGAFIDVPDGSDTGGSFEHLAPCRGPDDLACVVAYMSARDGDHPKRIPPAVPPGHHAACVDPAAGPLLAESVFPTAGHARLNLTTPYVSYRDFYRARCSQAADGRDYLEIAEARAPGDQRPSPIDLGKNNLGMGLHIYDYQLPQGDLVALVRTKLAAWQRRGALAH
jgi:hypothetical protein